MKLTDYLNEPMIVGGLPTTRGKFIADMLADGHSRRNIDIYLMGYDRQRSEQRDEVKELQAHVRAEVALKAVRAKLGGRS